jgi:hypothetical protein
LIPGAGMRGPALFPDIERAIGQAVVRYSFWRRLRAAGY